MTLFEYWEEATSSSNHRVGNGNVNVDIAKKPSSSRRKSSYSTTIIPSKTNISNRRHPWPQPKSSSSVTLSTKNNFVSVEDNDDDRENAVPPAGKSSFTTTNDKPSTAKKTTTASSATTKLTNVIQREFAISKVLVEKNRTGTSTNCMVKHKTSYVKPSAVVPERKMMAKETKMALSTTCTPDFIQREAAPVPKSAGDYRSTQLSSNLFKTATKNVSSNDCFDSNASSGNSFKPTPISEPAAYLVYEPDSSGRLVEHYVDSKQTPTSNENAIIGRWTASSGKKIATFKLKRNAGRNVLQGSCSAGVQGRRNYCAGWCQFVKSAFIQGSEDVTLWDPTGKGMKVDVYLYYDDDKTNPDQPQTVRLSEGVPTTTKNLRAVAAVPKNTPFYERHVRIGLHKWLQDGNNHGYSSMI